MSMNLRNLERFLEEVLVFEIQLKRLTKMENFVCSVDDEEEEEAIFGGFLFSWRFFFKYGGGFSCLYLV